MYRSKSNGITVYQGQAYSLSGSDVTIVTEGSKNSPPKKRVVKGATQAVFKALFELGHKAIYLEKAREIVKKED